jgi:DNA-binding transcriptional regulator YiaG
MQIQKGSIMGGKKAVPRYKYNRMTPQDMSADLDTLNLTAGQFSRISGARHERVQKWLSGEEDIPPHVPVLLALLELPGAMIKAQTVVDFYIREDDQ